MGGLFSSLNSSVEALRTIESALAVTQNNVSNTTLVMRGKLRRSSHSPSTFQPA